MTNPQEYENSHFLDAWLRHRIKYDQEYLDNLDKYKTTVKNLNFSWQNLEGKFVIENFPRLTTLNLGNNELEEVEIINCPELKKVITSHNKLTNLKVKDCKGIKELYTHNNKLKELDVSDITNLKILSYSDNPLLNSKKAELDALGLPKEGDTNTEAIKTLDDDFFIDNDEIEEIDISNEAGWEGKLEIKNCPNLTSLVVDNCKLEELIIENCPNLKHLSFRHNDIKEIDLSGLKKLEAIYCSNNELDNLDLSNNSKLKHLVCDNNPIDELNVKHLKELESLYCFKCAIGKLDCSNLKNLRELYCAHQIDFVEYRFDELTPELKEKYGLEGFEDDEIINVDFLSLEELNISGCISLEELDCAENGIGRLFIVDKPKLNFVSCKECYLENLTIINCPQLSFLDFSTKLIPSLSTKLIIDGQSPLEEVFHDKADIVPNWETFPNMKLLRVGEFKDIEYEEMGTKKKKKEVYSTEETDFVAIRNEKKIQIILDNPDNYSLEDILKLGKKELYGVSDELKEKLFALATQKSNENLRKKFFNENYLKIQTSISNIKTYWTSKGISNKSLEDILGRDWESFFSNKESSSEISGLETLLKGEIDYWINLQQKREETSSPLEKDNSPSENNSPELPTPQDVPNNPKKQEPELDYKKLYFELLEKIKKGEITLKNKEEIINSQILSEEEKQELLKMLEEQTKISSEKQPKSNNYLPYILGGIIIVLMIGVFAYLLRKRKKS